MLLFRSEEHLENWLGNGHARGAKLSMDQQWRLARAWFDGRHLPDWKRRTPQEAEAVFADVGLTGDFWHLS
jgi:hypothetical protein